MAATKKRRDASGAFPESQTRNHSRKSTKTRTLPDDLRAPLRGSYRQMVTAAEAYIQAGGDLYVEASWWTADNEISSAVLSDRDTAMAAAVACARSERDRDGVQA